MSEDPDDDVAAVERPHLETVEVEFALDGEYASVDAVESLLFDVAAEFELTVLTTETHQFEPQGITGVAIVGESHIAVHTWPQHNYGHLEILSCRGLPSVDAIEERISALDGAIVGVSKS